MTRIKYLILTTMTSVLLMSSLGTAEGGSDEFAIPWFTIDSGGGRSMGGGFTVSGTIGQTDTAVLTGGPFKMAGGFWAVSGDPRTPGDCNGNGILDAADVAGGTSFDCNIDNIPDECSLADSSMEDCNNDDVPDDCQIMRHYSALAGPPDDWDNVGNWVDLIDPSDGDHACIRCNGRTSDVAFNEGNVRLSSLASEIDFRIDGPGNPAPELQLDGPSFINGDLAMTGTAVLRNNDDLKVRGMLNWSGGTMRGSGTATVASGLTLTPPGNATNLRDSHHLVISGGSTTVNSKYIALSNTAAFTIGPDVMYTYNGSFNIFTGGLNTLVEVEGALLRASGDGRATISSGINATGLIHNQTGELQMDQGGTHSGEVRSDPGTTLRLGGPHEFLPSSTLTAERLILESGSGSFVRGTVDVSNSLECVGSTWTFTDEANIVDYSPLLSVVQGSLTLESPADHAVAFEEIIVGPSPPSSPSSNATFDSGQPVITATFGIYNGSVRGNSPISVTEHFIWQDGNFFAGGAISVEGTAEIRDSNHSRSTSRPLIIAGDATMLAGLTLNSGTRLDILPSGTFDLIGETSISGGVVNNTGVLLKSGADEQSTFLFGDINNTGTVELQTGITHLQQMDYIQTAGQTLLNGGGITSTSFNGLQINGGMLGGIGMADCDVDIDGGTMSPGLSVGEFVVGGDYMQTQDGTLEIEITGAGFGEFDVLTVGGSATLDGNLNVSFVNGYVPPAGSTFQIIAALDVEGEFADITASGLPASLAVEATYAVDSVTLEVVAQNAGDCDGNGVIELIDFDCFADCLQGPDGGILFDCEPFDFDGNGSVDLKDYGYFAQAFAAN